MVLSSHPLHVVPGHPVFVHQTGTCTLVVPALHTCTHLSVYTHPALHQLPPLASCCLSTTCSVGPWPSLFPLFLLFLATFPWLWEGEWATCPLLPGDYLLPAWGMPKAWLQAVGEQRSGRKSCLGQLQGETRPVPIESWEARTCLCLPLPLG
jgi:hypothetical protein